jgi:hypothetical protein
MKNLLFAIAVLLCTTIYAQNEAAKNSLFIRVYNLEGDKMNKGKILSVNDTILQLQGKNGSVDIDIRTIGLIKTKRSAGNNLLLGSLIGLGTGAIFGAIANGGDNSWFTTEEAAAGIGVIGAVFGTGIGGLSILSKNSKSYAIKGDASKWKVFEEMINGKKN